MPAGLQLFFNDGTSQLTDENVIFRFREKGGLSGGAPVQQFPNMRTITRTFSLAAGEVIMVCLHLPISYGWFVTSARTGNSQSVTFTLHHSAISSAEFFVFTSLLPPAVNSGAALEIRNSANQVVMTSNSPVCKPLGMYGYDGYVGAPLTGRKLAAVGIKPGMVYGDYYVFIGEGEWSSCGGNYMYEYLQIYRTTFFYFGAGNGAFREGSEVFQESYQICEQDWYPDREYEQDNSQIQALLIDVTNL